MDFRKKKYHWTIDGVPACHSKKTLGLATGCSGPLLKVWEWTDMFKAEGKEGVLDIVEGTCPRPNQRDNYQE